MHVKPSPERRRPPRQQLRLSDLSMLSAAEEHQLLVEWNETAVVYPREQSLAELFEAQVERSSEAVAVVYGAEQVSYGELNRRANQLAHYLRELGVGAETRVGLCVERSVEMVVGLLGILKAGGAYVPLDPAYPRERLAYMVTDAAVDMIITQEGLATELSGLSEAPMRLVCLNTEWERLSKYNDANVTTVVTSENLAYLIYTSGSTGRPKGIAIEHRSAITLIHWALGQFSRDELAGVMASTSICFDVSVFELLTPLSAGTKVILAENALQLPQLPAREQVTLINLVPSVMAELLRRGPVPAGVRTVNLAGEAVPQVLVEQLHEQLPGRRVLNLYGPSEDTTYTTYAELPRGERPTIGRPIANTQIYILDKHGKPVPVGVAGEIYISGDGLTRGYWQAPGQTAEKFVPNPFSVAEGARLYRTGDRASYLEDGQIEFIGRQDEQVKLRGFRIELGEIEAVLSSHPDVRSAVVVVREDPEKRLVAYVVGETPGRAELREYLSGKLPHYMVPSVFVTLAKLPLTPNGKVDRKALPAPTLAGSQPDSSLRVNTPIEEVMLGIWMTVLRLETVGIHDNFFELGGHSLLATQVISHVRDLLRVEIPLRIFFATPTIVELAKFVEAGCQEEAGLPIPPILPVPRTNNLPLSFSQLREWLLDQLQPGKSEMVIPFAIRLTGALDIRALELCIREIVKRHEALRTCFDTRDGQPVQIICPPGGFNLAVVDLQELGPADHPGVVQKLLLQERRRLFDLAAGPVLRATLLKLAAAEQVLLLTIHHIAWDGWSMGIFMRELSLLYRAFSAGKSSSLPELAIQYADFAVWQRQWLQGEVLERQLAYWKQQLNGAEAVLNLPTDRPRPVVQTFRGAVEKFQVPLEVSAALREISRRQGLTLYMVLLSAWQALLSRYTDQEDISVGSYIANRNRAETEALIGFFVNTVVMRTNLSGDPTISELFARVKKTTLGAYTHQDLPFEQVLEALKPERDRSYTPLFQVMFVLQNVPRSPLDLPGLKLDYLSAEHQRSNFDLTLWILKKRGEQLVGVLEYNRDLFEGATIKRMAAHLQTLLSGICATPEQHLSRLSLLSKAERRQLLVSWNQSAKPEPEHPFVHQLFEQQVERTPHNVALSCEGKGLSYDELNRRANQLADRLRREGVGPDVLVGICAERSIEMIVGLFAILKAGGAYLPIDPTLPAKRVEKILADARPALVISTGAELMLRFRMQEVKTLCVDSEWSSIAGADEENKPGAVNEENLAYVIYTSGSEGNPKGVMISHEALASYSQTANDEYGIGEHDRVLQFASISFDTSAEEIFPCLTCGGTLVLRTDEMIGSSRRFVEKCGEWKITVVSLPTAFWHELVLNLAADDWRKADRLKLVIIGGEKAERQRLQRWLQTAGKKLRLVNTYGPTEATIVATKCELVELEDTSDREVPLGSGLPGVQVYVLDRYQNPVPIGVPGELCVAGVGLARGYLSRPDLTAERFIPNPYGKEKGQRLYRTGDKAKWRNDGKLEYLGRLDNQVKVRGYRIEVGEIEARLREHPEIQDAVVAAREEAGGGGLRLIGWVAKTGNGLATKDVRAYLKQTLPEYMVPATFVFLDELPLNGNGKVDRRALVEPKPGSAKDRKPALEPRLSLDQELMKISESFLQLTLGQ